jgi:hypothetical protein
VAGTKKIAQLSRKVTAKKSNVDAPRIITFIDNRSAVKKKQNQAGTFAFWLGRLSWLNASAVWRLAALLDFDLSSCLCQQPEGGVEERETRKRYQLQ